MNAQGGRFMENLLRLLYGLQHIVNEEWAAAAASRQPASQPTSQPASQYSTVQYSTGQDSTVQGPARGGHTSQWRLQPVAALLRSTATSYAGAC